VDALRVTQPGTLSQLIADMAAAGAPMDAILLAVRAIEARDIADADRRAKAAERKRNERARNKDGTVARQSQDSHKTLNGQSHDPSPHEEISSPPTDPLTISNEMASPVESDPEPEKLTAEHVMEAYNGLADRLGLPKAEKMTKTRRRQTEARIRENPLENWHRALDAIERSGFLRGENDRGWRADFDFLIQPKTFTKLIEGAYDH
jgi:hypothetical protein